MNENSNYSWYRFPIKVIDQNVFREHDGEIEDDEWLDTWIDIRLDSIISIEPFMEEKETVTSTTIYTYSDFFTVEMKPSEVRSLLNYRPINK